MILEARCLKFLFQILDPTERRTLVWGLGFVVWGLWFGVWVLGFGVWSLEFGVRSLGFGVWGSG